MIANSKNCLEVDDPEGKRYHGTETKTLEGHTCRPWVEFSDFTDMGDGETPAGKSKNKKT